MASARNVRQSISALAGMYLQTVTKTAAYIVDSGAYPDTVVLFGGLAGGVACTLPAPTLNRVLVIKDAAGAASTHNITITPHASEDIDGASSYVLNLNYAGVTLGCDGTNWLVLSEYNGTVI
jgi:hypothetical protein